MSVSIDDGWIDASPDEVQAAVDLTLYAVVARYETSPDITEAEAKKAISDCNLIASMLERNGYEAVSIKA